MSSLMVESGRLEPTYEGLKAQVGGESLSSPPRLEPTYEGLKVTDPEWRVLEYRGLEPTYEGLKAPDSSLGCSRLPQFGAYL